MQVLLSHVVKFTFTAFAGWSAVKPMTTTGTAWKMASCMLLMPPCVTNAPKPHIILGRPVDELDIGPYRQLIDGEVACDQQQMLLLTTRAHAAHRGNASLIKIALYVCEGNIQFNSAAMRSCLWHLECQLQLDHFIDYNVYLSCADACFGKTRPIALPRGGKKYHHTSQVICRQDSSS